MNLMPLYHSNPISWVYMPQLIQRARAFAKKLDLDLDADYYGEALRVNFVAPNPSMLSWGIMDGHNMIGHLILSVDAIFDFQGNVKKRILNVLQLERDKDAKVTDEIRQDVMKVIHDTADAYYCSNIQAMAGPDALVKYYQKFGFKVYKTLMRIDKES